MGCKVKIKIGLKVREKEEEKGNCKVIKLCILILYIFS